MKKTMQNNMEKLRYISSERYVEGVIVEVTDGSVAIDFKGRMGQLKVPLRNIISDWPLELGQEVGMLMTIPEVLSGEVVEKYRKNIEFTQKMQRKMREDLKKKEEEK